MGQSQSCRSIDQISFRDLFLSLEDINNDYSNLPLSRQMGVWNGQMVQSLENTVKTCLLSKVVLRLLEVKAMFYKAQNWWFLFKSYQERGRIKFTDGGKRTILSKIKRKLNFYLCRARHYELETVLLIQQFKDMNISIYDPLIIRNQMNRTSNTVESLIFKLTQGSHCIARPQEKVANIIVYRLRFKLAFKNMTIRWPLPLLDDDSEVDDEEVADIQGDEM
jgi:hypothetical protein